MQFTVYQRVILDGVVKPIKVAEFSRKDFCEMFLQKAEEVEREKGELTACLFSTDEFRPDWVYLLDRTTGRFVYTPGWNYPTK